MDEIGRQTTVLPDGHALSLTEKTEQRPEALFVFEEQEEMERELVQRKLTALFAEHPWMAPELAEKDLTKIVQENASVRSRRRKVIAIANRMTAALKPYVACKPGCSQCCHMNTMIYEHEAIRLAEVTGRKMTYLPYRPINEVLATGDQYSGKPCKFLVENRCSVYEDRPLVCRTHHSLRDDPERCRMDVPAAQQVSPPMYDPDLLEMPYIRLNQGYDAFEPWGNIAEFFCD